MSASLLSSAPNYSSYHFRCVVDFVRVRLRLERASNFQSVKRALGLKYDEPVNSGPSGATKDFIVTIQDPSSWEAIAQQLRPLRETHGMANEPEIAEMEVSFDAYSKDQDRAALIEMTNRFVKFVCSLCSDNARAVKKKGEVFAVYQMSSDLLRKKIDRGFTIQIGNQADEIHQRMYLKTKDGAGSGPLARGRFVPLPADEHRARIEVTLKGAMLPDLSLANARAFKFETLSKWFKFRKVKPRLPDNMPDAALVSVVLMQQPALGAGGRSRRRSYHAWTAADRALNAIAYDALRHLTVKMGSTRAARARRRNSGNDCSANPASPEESGPERGASSKDYKRASALDPERSHDPCTGEPSPFKWTRFEALRHQCSGPKGLSGAGAKLVPEGLSGRSLKVCRGDKLQWGSTRQPHDRCHPAWSFTGKSAGGFDHAGASPGASWLTARPTLLKTLTVIPQVGAECLPAPGTQSRNPFPLSMGAARPRFAIHG